MRLGCCAGIEKAGIVHDAGFDFLECTIASLIPEESEVRFRQDVLKSFTNSPVPVEAFNVFLPGDIVIVGDAVDWDRIERYVGTALKRVKQAGADIVVFGSGGARNIPEGFSREKGEEQVLNFLDIVADYADPLGITVVIEPLCKKESNLINSVPEAIEFAKKVDRPSIRALADFYHMDEENEPLTNIVENGQYLRHIHVADTGRKAPGTGSYPYEEFADSLKKSGYNGRISVECGWDDFGTEIKKAKPFLADWFGNTRVSGE